MIVTIDGPAGAGKSTVARKLADRLGFQFLDTGAMYRAVAFAAVNQQADFEDSAALISIAQSISIELDGESVLIDGIDRQKEIRQPEISGKVGYVADQPAIRDILIEQQRSIARAGNYVCEGRDQGSVVFPDAECKIFLTASAIERAKRRLADLDKAGVHIDLEKIKADQDKRDQQDYRRKIGGLVRAEDAIEFVTDYLSLAEVVDQLEGLVRQKLDLKFQNEK